MTSSLTTETFALGEWQTNCYVVYNAAGACWIVDAGFEPAAMIEHIRRRDLKLENIILTHAHLDHIAGLNDIHAAFPDTPILIHAAEKDFLTDTFLNLSAMINMPIVAPEATGFLAHGQILKLGDASFEVRHTPGHSPGGVTLYCAAESTAFVGDALFASSIGRTDFPTSNHTQLMASIREQLLTLPDATRVLSGHGPATTIGRERKSNPFIQAG